MPIILEIINFQSIPHAIVELEGFIVFQGATHRGKSAVVRALRSLFYNEWHANWQRRGTDACILKATLPPNDQDINTITLEKPENKYTITFHNSPTREYPKVGKEVPDELKKLHFEIITTEHKDKFNMSFQTQLRPLFLITDPEPVLTSFFNKLFDVAKYEGALRRMNSDQLKLNREFGAKSIELETKKAMLDSKTVELETLRSTRSKFDALYKEFQEKENNLVQIEDGFNRFADLKAREQLLSNMVKDGEAIHAAIKLIEDQFLNLRKILALEDSWIKNDVVYLELLNIKEQIGPVNAVISKFQGFDSCLSKIYNLSEFSYRLADAIFDVQTVEDSQSVITAFSVPLDRCKTALSNLYRIHVVQTDFVSKSLKISEDQILESVNQSMILSLNQYDEDIKNLVGICPTCQKPFNSEGECHGKEN